MDYVGSLKRIAERSALLNQNPVERRAKNKRGLRLREIARQRHEWKERKTHG